MARVVNYEQKIEGLKAKIEKKTEELKKIHKVPKIFMDCRKSIGCKENYKAIVPALSIDKAGTMAFSHRD